MSTGSEVTGFCMEMVSVFFQLIAHGSWGERAGYIPCWLGVSVSAMTRASEVGVVLEIWSGMGWRGRGREGSKAALGQRPQAPASRTSYISRQSRSGVQPP